jgi:hypothetical protein
MNDDVTNDVEEICWIIDVSYVDWMMRWIGCKSRELHLSAYSGSSLYTYRGFREGM